MMNVEHALTFGKGNWLWALFLIVPLLFLFYRAEQRRHQILALLVSSRLRSSLLQAVSPWKRITRSLLFLLAWSLLVVALAKPRFGYEEKKITTHGRDVILAIDTSRSMLATDVTPTRLARAQLLGQDILDLLPGDRVGLIAFAGDAFLQAPMTLDHHAVTAALSELDTTLIPKGGTDIAAAIQMAEVAFGKGEGTSRALIIITDGEDLEVNAITEAQKAAAQGIKIFTLGLGSVEGSLIPIKTEQQRTDFVRDEQGKPVLSKLDAPRLKEIATVTGGFYEPFNAQAARSLVEKGIIPLEAGTTGDTTTRRPIERYEFPLSLAGVLLLISFFLKETRFSFPRFMKKKSTGLVLMIFWGSIALANASTGMKEYKKGNYQAALDDFEKRLHATNPLPEATFDAGAAAYKKGDYKKAITYFTGAMTAASPKLEQAATYNLANALVRSGETAQNPSEKMSDWKNAIQHYDTVLKKDPQNKAAQENRDIVKKLLEELKKQQEEQQKNPENKDTQKNKDQQQPDQQQKDQKSSSESQQNNNPAQQQQPPDNKNQESAGKEDQKPSPSQPDTSKSKEASSSGTQPQSSPIPNPTPSAKEASSSASPTPAALSSSPGAPSPTPSPMPGKGEESKESPSKQPPASSEKETDGKANSSSAPSSGVRREATPSPTPGEKKNGSLKEAGADLQKTTPAGEPDVNDQEKQDAMSPYQAEALLRSLQEEEEQVKFQQRHESEETTKDW